ncbi:MAG TPA: 23S rRNA (uracil(1939)-C(5))-methyltransferase RlmD [Gammaproteobacteria bacterium]|nr:23S rRNA (uracil(1939)-C(5))-methyltransferase RlmD [Gammaproteobacteria bacterium]
MARRSRRKPLPQGEFETTIESLSHEGRGVTHIDGKAMFIDGALAGEKVMFRYTGRQRSYDSGIATRILERSPDRVEPRCEHAAICGGCSLQHLAADRQIAFKQQAMLEGLQHIGKVTPQEVLPPLTADSWGYRRKARLGVRHVAKKGRVLVGFREKQSGFLADINHCPVLHPDVGEKITALCELIGSMDAKEKIPQIEAAVGDAGTALVIRHLESLSDADIERLKAFEAEQGLALYLQSKGPASVVPLTSGSQPPLYYEHPGYQVKVEIGPLDFFQVNAGLNRKMVPLALSLLELKPEDSVLDLFCGLGNFTLPMARHVKTVTGVEGDQTMVDRARENALANGIDNTRYYVTNLMGELKNEPWMSQQYDKILLDPPRAGAKEVIEGIGQLGAERIVYVSCHPGTLARDAGELVNTHGYQLLAAGVMDMFPHTAHVESIAVFSRTG